MGSQFSTSEASPRLPDYQMHPEDRYYPSFYKDQMNHYPNSRANIDPYATLTPSERLRPRVHSGKHVFMFVIAYPSLLVYHACPLHVTSLYGAPT